MRIDGWLRVARVRAPAGSFEPTVVALGLVVVLAIGWLVWEFYVRDKKKN
jgi:hypothetical protein